MKPIIGIVSRSTKDNEGYSILYTNSFVSQAIIKSGGIPFTILPTQEVDYESDIPAKIIRLNDDDKDDINKVLNMCDGIVIPGGVKWYEYDEYICKYAIEHNIPFLGICAGMQLLAKVLNNNKIDGIDNTVRNNTTLNHHQKDVKYVHNIQILEDSLLYRIVNKTVIPVNSRHNYHVPNELSFLSTAYSEDGLIEAVEYKDNEFVLGIQWHPESMIDYDENAKKIFNYFIKICEKK